MKPRIQERKDHSAGLGGWTEGGVALTSPRSFVLQHGSDRRQTLPKRVSDDPRQLNFRREKTCSRDFLVSEIVFGLFELVLEPPAENGPQNQLPRNFLL